MPPHSGAIHRGHSAGDPVRGRHRGRGAPLGAHGEVHRGARKGPSVCRQRTPVPPKNKPRPRSHLPSTRNGFKNIAITNPSPNTNPNPNPNRTAGNVFKNIAITLAVKCEEICWRLEEMAVTASSSWRASWRVGESKHAQSFGVSRKEGRRLQHLLGVPPHEEMHHSTSAAMNGSMSVHGQVSCAIVGHVESDESD